MFPCENGDIRNFGYIKMSFIILDVFEADNSIKPVDKHWLRGQYFKDHIPNWHILYGRLEAELDGSFTLPIKWLETRVHSNLPELMVEVLKDGQLYKLTKSSFVGIE